MSRNSYGRYKPDHDWYTPEEHQAMQQELLVLGILVVMALGCVFAEPLMDVFMAILGAP